MNSLPMSVFSLLFVRMFLLVVTLFCAAFVWLAVARYRRTKKHPDRFRWLIFGLFFILLGSGLYVFQLTGSESLHRLTDAVRPRDLRIKFVQPARVTVFWETGEPVTGFVRFGFSPDNLVFVSRAAEDVPKTRHAVALSEPIPPEGFWAVIYSNGKPYPPAGEPHFFRD